MKGRELIVGVAVLILASSCGNIFGGGGDDAPTTDDAPTAPATLSEALLIIEKLPPSIGSDFVNSGSESSAVAPSTPREVDLSAEPPTVDSFGDLMYGTIGFTLDMYAWLERNDLLPASGTVDLGTVTPSEVNDGTLLGERLYRVFQSSGITSVDLGTVRAETATETQSFYISFLDQNSQPVRILLQARREGGVIRRVAFHVRSTTSEELGSGPGQYGVEEYAEIAWTGPDSADFSFTRHFDRDGDGAYRGSGDPGTVILGEISPTRTNLALATEEFGLQYSGVGNTAFGVWSGNSEHGGWIYSIYDNTTFDGFYLQALDDTGAFLAEGAYDGEASRAVPTGFDHWSVRRLVVQNDEVTLDEDYSGATLLWDDNDTEADSDHDDDIYELDTDGDNGGDITLGDGGDDAEDVMETKRANNQFPYGLPVARHDKEGFSTYFDWNGLSGLNGMISQAASFLGSSEIGIGGAVDSDNGDVKALITEIKSSVPSFPSLDQFPEP